MRLVLSRRKWDKDAVHELWQLSAENFYPGYFYDYFEKIDFLLSTSDGSNILDNDVLLALMESNDYVLNEMSVPYRLKTGE